MGQKEDLKVVFRKWNQEHGGDIIALFPTVPADYEGLYCNSYEHVGQHGSADYHYVVSISVPAYPEEYDSLLQELTGIYNEYELKPVKRATYKDHLKRVNESRRSKQLEVDEPDPLELIDLVNLFGGVYSK